MTRDEADEKATEAFLRAPTYSAAFVNILIALDLLKIDEPKPEPTPWERLSKAWPTNGKYTYASVYPVELRDLLTRAGLTLVHKKEGE